jgi:hypothetical protein
MLHCFDTPQGIKCGAARKKRRTPDGCQSRRQVVRTAATLPPSPQALMLTDALPPPKKTVFLLQCVISTASADAPHGSELVLQKLG